MALGAAAAAAGPGSPLCESLAYVDETTSMAENRENENYEKSLVDFSNYLLVGNFWDGVY